MKRLFKNEFFLNSKSKTFWKLFLLIFIANIIVFNWDSLSWLFNYRVALQGIQSVISEETKTEYSSEGDSIEIKAINIKAPLIFPEGENNAEIYDALMRGVAHFPTSSLPGERGVVILLGHSSPLGRPKIDYEWVFSEAEKLKPGDEIRIVFSGRVFTYVVTEKVVLEIGQDVPSYKSDKSEIILLSCWPPGRNIKRMGVRGVLK